MKIRGIPYLTEEKLAFLKNKVFLLLEEKGIRMDHPGVLEILGKQGAKIDNDAGVVYFPGEFLEEQIMKAPKEFSLFGREGKHQICLSPKNNTFNTRANTGAQSWLEPESDQCRGVKLSDIADWAQLVNALEHIDFTGFPTPGDAPAATADVHALQKLLIYCEKHIWVQPHIKENIDSLIELSLAAFGGGQKLNKQPPVSFIACSFSPLAVKQMDLEIILKCAQRGIPLHLCSLPMAGSTAPFTEPGVVVLAVAEILSMLAVAQSIKTRTPVIATPIIFSTDMRTGKSLQSSIISLRSCALAVHFIKRVIGIPVHTYGIGSDSPSVGVQSMVEGTLRGVLMASSGADILGGAGQLETATTISPVQLILDNEIFRNIRELIAEKPLNDDTLAWDDLMNFNPGGHFLGTKHTRHHSRKYIPSPLFRPMGRKEWENAGRKGPVEHATALSKDLMNKSSSSRAAEDVIKELNRIVDRADKRII